MVNRIINNVLIIDSNSGVLRPILAGSGGMLRNFRVEAASFFTASLSSPNGKFELVSAVNSDTTVIALGPGFFSGNSFDVNVPLKNPFHMYFGGVNFGELRVKTLTAGTAYLYLS